MRAALYMLLIAAGIVFAAAAQESGEDEKSVFLSWVENRLSTDNRRISISGISGLLSSDAGIDRITIADRKGVWLTLSGARIVWTRSALLAGRLEIDQLAADRIEMTRRPLPDKALPSPETSPFSVPELPVSVDIAKLAVGTATFSEQVFGKAAELSLEGRLLLDGGSLDTALGIDRRDGPGGRLDLAASYSNATRYLAIDLAANEPADGVLANLLKIHERPPIALSLKGEGPLDRFAADLSLDAAARRVLSGTIELDDRAGDLGFDARLAGTVAPLVPAAYRAFFGEENRLRLRGKTPAGGGFEIDELALSGGALALQARARILPDGFLRELDLDATFASADGAPVVLPVAGAGTTLGSANLAISYGSEASGRWSGVLAAQGLSTGELDAARVRIDMGGEVANLDDPGSRFVSLRANGAAEGIGARNGNVAKALGERITLALEGRHAAGRPWLVDTFAVATSALTAEAAGTVADSVFTGGIALRTSSLAPFSGLAGRPLSGAADVTADGTVAFLEGGFDLGLDGRVTDLGIGGPQADRLFAGVTAVSGRLARGKDGVAADRFRIANPRIELTADGGFSTRRADFRIDLAIADLNLVDTRLAGPLSAKGTLDGDDGVIAAQFAVAVPSGSILDRSLREASLSLQGTFDRSGFEGRLDGGLFLEGDSATLSSEVVSRDGRIALAGVSLRTRGATLAGDIARDAEGLFDGALKFDAPDVSTLAVLALREASGAAAARIALAAVDGKQQAQVTATAKGLRLDDPKLSVGALDLDADIGDLFGVPVADASFAAGDVAVAGINVASAGGTARSQQGRTVFETNARLGSGTRADLAGALAPLGDGYRLSLERAGITRDGEGLALREPADLTVAGDRIELTKLRFSAGGGSIEADGVLAETLDLQLLLDRVPLDMANLVRPDLAARGTLGGVVTIGGTSDRPEADFLLRGQGVSMAALATAGIEPLSVDLEGRTEEERLVLDLALGNAQGVEARVSGHARIDGEVLDLDVDLASFPLAALDALAPGTDLGGRLAGTATVTGTLATPAASFDLEGTGVTAALLSGNGIPPLKVKALGAYSGRAVRLQQATASGAGGFDITASGMVPLAGDGLSVDFSGNAPLSAANRLLAERGAVATGTARFEGRAGGLLARPRLSGSLSVTDGGFADPSSNLRLQSIALNANVEGDTVRVGSFAARLATGGSVSASGTISLQPDLPADLAVRLENARYSDGELAAATVSGDLSVSGSLMRDPLIAGAILVHRAELTVPERMAAAAEVAGVDHVRAPAAVHRTVRKALPDKDAPIPTARPSVPRLDLRIDAPARVFLRGRGLDAELGGSMVVRGPVFDVQPSGGFEIVRGRLTILGQRIKLDSGRLTLIGDLDPFVDLTATTSGNDIDVTISVTGRISDLDISFSSQPDLPQDEILSRLLFGQGISSLSPLQLARLAAAAAELAGGGPSILDGVREATGLDDLDVVTDEEGNTTAKAGRYVTDNVYLGVEAGAKGKTRVTIDLDISGDVKARGSISEDDSSVGIFFERDY